jgi:hypothetical protein
VGWGEVGMRCKRVGSWSREEIGSMGCLRESLKRRASQPASRPKTLCVGIFTPDVCSCVY